MSSNKKGLFEPRVIEIKETDIDGEYFCFVLFPNVMTKQSIRHIFSALYVIAQVHCCYAIKKRLIAVENFIKINQQLACVGVHLKDGSQSRCHALTVIVIHKSAPPFPPKP